jgi:subtilisin family serine protease
MVGYVSLFAQAPPEVKARNGIIQVKVNRDAALRIGNVPRLAPSSSSVLKTGITAFDAVNSKVKAFRVKRLIPYSPKFEEKHKQYGLDLWYTVEFDSTAVTPQQAMTLYKSVSDVQCAETLKKTVIYDSQNYVPVDIDKMKAAADASPFNDPLLPKQWHYNNDGSVVGSVAGADINLYKAWNTETGSQDVLVAIVDGGVDYTHPDLKQNMYVNEKELNGNAGVDDDGNGYVDDIYGYNFVINSSDVSAHSHGTHVAGTVGAVNNNGIGVCGVAGGNGNGGVKMLSCQIFDNRSNINANNAAALVYAADMGASIAQCSWGWSEPDVYEQPVLDAIDYFTKEGGGSKMKGGLCIFASGNNGATGNYYPACYAKSLAVGAITCKKEPATYSNYGEWVDVSAPGGDLTYGQNQGVLSTLPNATYGYYEGTSMACPHVSGIAALVLSKYGNKDFPVETLRQQLVSSVNDLYTDNPDATGKYGSGIIDAYKSLQLGSGAAPSPVTDIRLTPSQDNILIEWTIPQSDEKSVDHHLIYYSTSKFTNTSDLSKLPYVSVDTKFNLSGDAMKYELGGLQPLTTYYVALQAINRWGNASALSAVEEATTNAGPKAALPVTSSTLNLNASVSDKGQSSFAIENQGDGMLKYDITASTRSVSPSYYSMSNDMTAPGKVVPFNGDIALMSVTQYPVVSADYMKEDYPKTITYSNGMFYYVGDNDLTKPNALAQHFNVDATTYPNGFNLTALRFGGAYGKDPVIEIYDGSTTISKASLITTVDYDYFGYGYDINLKEQQFFAPGSSFWIVAKFPAKQSNPLGMGKSSSSESTKQFSFYSGDNGKTWSQLSEVLKSGNLADVADEATWDVYAVSKNPDWSSLLVINPDNGTVRPHDKQDVSITNDGQKMVNGKYVFKLNVNTNDTENKVLPFTLNMNVTGNKPSLTSAKMIDFGDVIVGQSKTIDVEMVNYGYGNFVGSGGYLGTKNISSSSDQFVVPTYKEGLSARSKSTLSVTFKPTKSGSQSGTITLTDKNGISYAFTVRGISAFPAKLQIDKDTFNVGDLNVGSPAKDITFTLKNIGEYPLEYVFPKYSNETISGAEKSHKFGYSYISNINGSTDFAYDGNEELTNSVDITNQFNDNNWMSTSIDLGFDFPFYGQKYSSVYVTSQGSVTMKTIEGHISCVVPTGTCVDGLGYLSAFSNSGRLDFGANSRISYARQDGKFIVKFKDVLVPVLYGGDGRKAVSFHLALLNDGSFEVYYDDYSPSEVFGGGQYNFVGVSDIDCKDPFVITDYDKVLDEESTLCESIHTGTAIKIIAPAKSIITNISSPAGIINIGDAKQITVSVAASDSLYAGKIVNNLTLLTSDPTAVSHNIRIEGVVKGDMLKPIANVDSSSVDFGKVFRTSQAIRVVLLRNVGSDSLRVQSVKASKGLIIVDSKISNGFVVAPGCGKDIRLTLPTETEGAVNDEITITYSDGTTAVIPVKGTVIGVPQFDITPSTVTATTPYKNNVAQTFTVENKGNETLTFTTVPSDWIVLSDPTADSNSEIGYSYRSKTDDNTVGYDWIDLTSDSTAEHKDLTYYLSNTDYHKVSLPFSFPFYGKTYDTMYIYDTGFVSFSEHTDYKEFPEPPAMLPTTETFYTNIIAPFWGLHTMDTPKTDGTYYKAEKDRVIVSYIGYGNSMMMGMDYQVILMRDGSFKFQYHLEPNGMMLGVFGLGGLQDEYGKRGITLPRNYIQDNNAVEFYPSKTFNVPSNGSITLPVDIKADSLAGIYDFNITMNTNVPTQPVVTVPVKLEITGKAEPVYPKSITIDAISNANNYNGITTEFEIANSGSKAFTINDISSSLINVDGMGMATLMYYGKMFDPLYGEEVTGWFNYVPQTPITIGTTPAKFKALFYDASTVRQENCDITFNVSGVEGKDTLFIPFNLVVHPAPLLSFDKPEIVINGVSANYQGKESLNISNNGEYKLTYSLRLDPSGRGETLPDAGGGIDPGIMNVKAGPLSETMKANVMNRMAKANAEGYVYDVPDMDYKSLLYYPILDVPSPNAVMLGSGTTTSPFLAATRYIAPEDGFNLTHLYFVGTIGDLENVDIEANVILGNDVTSENIIGHGKITVESETPAGNGGYYGNPRILEFDKPIFINPNDTFYVSLKYPVGYPYSALICQKADEVSEGRFMAWLSGSGWIDLGTELQDSYGSMGYFMTCVEQVEGKPWIKLLNEKHEGEIAVGDKLEVNLQVDASSTYFEKNNKAVLVIKSNDPQQPLVNFPITLNKNAAPVVKAASDNISVNEGSTIVTDITVSDEEGDAFDVSLLDESGIVNIDSCSAVSGNNDGFVRKGETISVAAGESVILSVNLSPGYGVAGTHSMLFNTVDKNGNSRMTTVPYIINHTNRAPMYKGADEMTIYKGQNSDVVAFSSLFDDPDGDDMTFTASLPTNDAYASVFTDKEGFILKGEKLGHTNLYVDATDNSGLITRHTIKVTVAPPTGIDSNNSGSELSLYPVPVKTTLSVTMNTDADNVTYRIYDNAGRMVSSTTAAHKSAGDAQVIDMSGLASGVYRLLLIADGKNLSTTFIKAE